MNKPMPFETRDGDDDIFGASIFSDMLVDVDGTSAYLNAKQCREFAQWLNECADYIDGANKKKPFDLATDPGLKKGDKVVSVVNDDTEDVELIEGKAYTLTEDPSSIGENWFFNIGGDDKRWVSHFRPLTSDDIEDNASSSQAEIRDATEAEMSLIFQLYCARITRHGDREEALTDALKDLDHFNSMRVKIATPK